MKKWGIWVLLILCAFCFGAMFGYGLGQRNGSDNLVFSGISTDLQPSQPVASDPSGPVYPININTATVEQLQTLPGIGPTLAQAIVTHRQTHGAFLYPEELANVEGIGQTRLDAILDLITTGG